MSAPIQFFHAAHRRLFTAPSTDMPVLNGIRAWAIIAVFGLHIMWPLSLYLDMDELMAIVKQAPPVALILQGHFGVDAFFVLSGFLIATLYFRDYETGKAGLVRTFFLKRALRLLPPYYAVLIVSYATMPQHCPSVWSNFMYVNNYLPMQEVCVFWSWSLAIEEQFYLAFPLFCVVLYRIRRPHLLFVGLLLLASLGNVGYLVSAGGFSDDWDFARRFYQPTQFRFGAILLGVYVAYLHRNAAPRLKDLAGRKIWSRGGYALGILLMALPIFIPSNSILRQLDSYTFGASVYEGLYRYIFSLGVAILMLLMLNQARPSRLARHLSRGAYYPLAKLSYALYLVHPLFILELYSALFEDLSDLLTIVPLSIVGSVSGAYVLYLLVEAPSAALRARLLSSASQAPARASVTGVPILERPALNPMTPIQAGRRQ